jgi:hypothetical protein
VRRVITIISLSEKDIKFVITENIVAELKKQNNGAGAMWNIGSPISVRHNNKVFVTIPEVCEKAIPLCNTRWQLFMKENKKEWELVQKNGLFDEREPCPIVRFKNGDLFISTNPAEELRSWHPEGYYTWLCKPKLLRLDLNCPYKAPKIINPKWSKKYEFTDHSYRGMGADSKNEELILFNVEGYEGYAWSYFNKDGEWTSNGDIKFPERGCFPMVSLKDKKAWVITVEDIVEPNIRWKEHKSLMTGERWDYVFRKLYFTYNPNVSNEEFKDPIVIANYGENAGSVMPRDLLVDEDDNVHILYIAKNIEKQIIRDKFFPNMPMFTDLVHCKISKDNVKENNVLLRYYDNATIREENKSKLARRSHYDNNIKDTTFITDEIIPVDAILHRDEKRNIYAVFLCRTKSGDSLYIMQLTPDFTPVPLKIPVKYPPSSKMRDGERMALRISSASERMGSDPSSTLDIFGERDNLFIHLEIDIQI